MPDLWRTFLIVWCERWRCGLPHYINHFFSSLDKTGGRSSEICWQERCDPCFFKIITFLAIDSGTLFI
ncbi:MAG: hypothetical protein NC824_01765, partial [Candidatus Omnitrophica bacterium]|nr:hypothetical protein [Candidatus Omnitrophota bacterium]